MKKYSVCDPRIGVVRELRVRGGEWEKKVCCYCSSQGVCFALFGKGQAGVLAASHALSALFYFLLLLLLRTTLYTSSPCSTINVYLHDLVNSTLDKYMYDAT